MAAFRAYFWVFLAVWFCGTNASAQSPGDQLKTDIETSSVTITADDFIELTVTIENIRAKSETVGASRFSVDVVEKPGFLKSVEVPNNGQVNVLATQKDADIKFTITPQGDAPKGEGVLKIKITAEDEEVFPNERLLLVPITYDGKIDVKAVRTIITEANYRSSETIQENLRHSSPETSRGELLEAGHERQRVRLGITNDGEVLQRPLNYMPPVPAQGSGEYQEFVVDVVRRLAFAPPDEIVIGEPYSIRICASVDMVYVAGDEPLTKSERAKKQQLILNAYMDIRNSETDPIENGVAPPTRQEGNLNARHIVDLDWPGVGQAKTTRAEIIFQGSPVAGQFRDKRRKAYRVVITEGAEAREAYDTYVLGGEMTAAEEAWAGRSTTGLFGIPERDFDPYIPNIVATQFTLKDVIRTSDAIGSIKWDRDIKFRYDVPEDGVTANVLRDAPFARGDDICAPADEIAGTGQDENSGATVLTEVPPYVFFVVQETGGLVGFKSENLNDPSLSGYTASYRKQWVLRVDKGQSVADALKRLGVLSPPGNSCGSGGPNTARGGGVSWRANSGPLFEIMSGPYLQKPEATAEAGDGKRVILDESGGGPSYDDWKAALCGD